MKSFLSILKSIKSIAIGKFDGIHLGHQKILKALNKDSAVIVIDNNVTNVLTTLKDRLHRIPNSYVLSLDSIKDLQGEDFIKLLCDTLPKLRRIVVGYDFRFGKNRIFGANDLQERFKGEVKIIPKISYHGIPVHSSVIKDLIRHGDISVANAMLGWNYSIKGEVISGQNIAHKELFATLNIKTQDYVIPASGVYASFANDLKAVSFIGHRLSTDKNFAIETHILDKNIKSAPESLRLTFIKKLRENQYFKNLGLLKAQITKDIAQAREILES